MVCIFLYPFQKKSLTLIGKANSQLIFAEKLGCWSVRSMKLTLAGYNTKTARWWVRGFARAERRRADGGCRRMGWAEQQLGGSEAGWERPAVRILYRGRALWVRNVKRVDCVVFLATRSAKYYHRTYSKRADEGGQHELAFRPSWNASFVWMSLMPPCLLGTSTY